LVCTLAESQEFVSGSGATAVQAQGRVVSTEPLPALEPKAQVSWRVVAKALSPDDCRFKVEMTSDQLQRPVEETEASRQF
jgi:hypothetical protein